MRSLQLICQVLRIVRIDNNDDVCYFRCCFSYLVLNIYVLFFTNVFSLFVLVFTLMLVHISVGVRESVLIF